MPAFRWSLVAAALIVAAMVDMASAGTLQSVRDRGHVRCGVGAGQLGFAQPDSSGRWAGLDVDFCSALAAAVVGDKAAVKIRPLMANDRFRALAEGEIDVLAGSAAWSLSTDNDLGIRFAGILFHNGLGVLVPRGTAIGSVFELSGANLCLLAGSRAEPAVASYFGRLGMRYQPVALDRWDGLVRTYAKGGCTALVGNVADLAVVRSAAAAPSEHAVLPELLTKEPLGPAVRAGDDQWLGIVRWTVLALIEAEELGITAENAAAMRSSPQQDVRRFLGIESHLGQGLGLSHDWPYQIVSQVGNYAEIFDRNLGEGSPLRLSRGLNQLWSKGGLLYGMPFR